MIPEATHHCTCRTSSAHIRSYRNTIIVKFSVQDKAKLCSLREDIFIFIARRSFQLLGRQKTAKQIIFWALLLFLELFDSVPMCTRINEIKHVPRRVHIFVLKKCQNWLPSSVSREVPRNRQFFLRFPVPSSNYDSERDKTEETVFVCCSFRSISKLPISFIKSQSTPNCEGSAIRIRRLEKGSWQLGQLRDFVYLISRVLGLP